MHTFYGHFFVRSTDLLALPNVSPDNGYSFQVAVEESLVDAQKCAFFQAALLYTSSCGERRIRVHTLCLPVTKDVGVLMSSADAPAIASMLAKMAVDKALQTRLTDARDAMIHLVSDTLSVFRAKFASNAQWDSQLIAPDSLRMLPLFVLALLKHPAFRLGTTTRLDERAHAMVTLRTLPMWEILDFIYPRLYCLHNIQGDVGVINDEGVVQMPPLMHLSAESVHGGGIYLLHNALDMYMWVSKSCPPQLLQSVFGVDYDGVIEGMIEVPIVDSELNKRIRTIIKAIRSSHPRHLLLHVVKETSRERFDFVKHLVDDRSDSAMSYAEFLSHIHRSISK